MMIVILFLFCTVVAYFIGSVNSAIIVSRVFKLPDPRESGSKNPGATNVLRLSGKKYGALVLVTDIMKGILPVLLARLLQAPSIVIGFTCLAAVIGHVYPFFFNFKGGKGVATTIGALLALNFYLGLMVVAVWLILVWWTRYVSLASMSAALLAPLFAIYSENNLSTFIPLLCIAFLVLYQHRTNLKRLSDGTEPKIK